MHLGGQESEHPTDVGEHAGREQPGDDAPAEGRGGREDVVLVVRVEVPGDAAEEGDVAVGEGAAVDELLARFQRLECLAQARSVVFHLITK
jgi:hypothetical protein